MAILGKPNPNEGYEALFQTARRARLPFDRERLLNTLFFLGEQYAEWGDDIENVRKIPKPENAKHIPRPVANKLKHFVLQEHAMTLQSKPTSDVMPATDEPGDISDAAVCGAYLTWLFDPTVANFDRELSMAALWALAGTEGFLKWIWNPRLDDGKGRGDIIACDPGDIYQDPYAKSFDRCRYVIHRQFMDVESVYDQYGIEVRPSVVDKADAVRIALQREMGMAPVLQGAMTNELWMKPNRRNPRGLFVVWCDSTRLVEPQPYPYAHMRLPFTQIGSIPWLGTGHYTSILSDGRSPQMELNRAHAQGIEIRNAFSNPKFLIPNELDMDSDPDDSPNQILRYNSMGGALHPQILQPSAMPSNDFGAWITREMMDVFGLHEVSQAQVPGRVEAAKAIELLKESDDGRLAEMIRTISAAITEGSYQQLMLAKQYMPNEQLITIYSPEGAPEIRKFKRDQIKPGIRVRTTMQTGLARSRAARVDQLMLMWQNGIIQDRELMAQLLDMPLSTLSPANTFDIKLARNENLTMAGGDPVTPNSWDNHEIHLRELNNYRKTLEYQMLATERKSMFEYHGKMHEQLWIQELGKQLQRMQLAAAIASGAAPQPALAAGPPGSGGAPQPGGGDSFPPMTPQREASYQTRTEFTLNHPRV